MQSGASLSKIKSWFLQYSKWLVRLGFIFHLSLIATWKRNLTLNAALRAMPIQLPQPILVNMLMIYQIQNGLSISPVTEGIWKISSWSQEVRTSPRGHIWTLIQMLASLTSDLIPLISMASHFKSQGAVSESSTIIPLIIKTAFYTQPLDAIWKNISFLRYQFILLFL